MPDWEEVDTAEKKVSEPDTSVVGKRCRFRGVDGNNFDGVVEEMYDWGELIRMDDGTPRQVFYGGLIWSDILEDKPDETDSIKTP